MSETKDWIATKKSQRLDILCLESGISRRKVRQVIDSGGVKVEGKIVRIASREVKKGQRVEMQFDLPALKHQNFRRKYAQPKILGEEDAFVVIDKPSFVASLPMPSQKTLNIVDWAAERWGKQMSLVHRLDLETSGCMVLAKTAEAEKELSRQFRQREVKKRYLAWVIGKTPDKFESDARLSAIDPRSKTVKVLKKGGKEATTTFERLDYRADKGISLVACYPKTGRTHQIRVHLEALGYPICGDKVYGTATASPSAEFFRLMLHAHRLEFEWEGQGLVWEAPVPDEFVLS